ncbi:MAG: PAS domain S-box protein [Spirochaetaceae bacterium]
MKSTIPDSETTEKLNLKNNDRLENVLRCLETGAWEMDLESNLVWRSLQLDKIFGYTEPIKEWTFNIFIGHVVDEDRDMVNKIFRKSISEITDCKFECRINKVDGNICWILVKGSHEVIKNKKPNKMFGIVQDITEKKITEEKTQATEANLKSTFDLSPSIICKANLKTGYFVEANQAVTRILGYSVEEFTSRPFIEFIHPEDQQKSTDEKIEQINGKEVTFFENRYLCTNGSYTWMAWHGTKADKNGIVNAIGTEITDRKHFEEALKESEERFRTISENAPGLINSFDADGKCLFWNKQCQKTFGWTLEEINQHDSAMPLFYPDPTICEEVLNSFINEKDGIFKEWHPVTKDGNILSIMWANFSLPNGQVFSMGHDITERKQTEESLIKLKTAIEISEVNVIITNNEGLIEYANPYFTKLTGYSLSEVIGKNPRILNSGFHPKEFYEDMWSTVNSGQTWEGEFRNRKKNGDLYWEKAIISPIQNETKIITNYVAIKTDISEDKKIEEQLRQSQKMEAIGQLAGGIAHDFNNMLTGIMGCAEIISTQVADDQELSKFVDLIMDTSMQAAELTKKLLSFSRNVTPVNKIFDIHEAIAKTSSMLERSIDKSILIKSKLNANNSMINGDQSLIETSLLNLGINARDVMPKGGELTFVTKDISFNESNKSPDLNIVNGEYIEIDVQDTGLGMTKEVQERIFEPFYTTKKIGKGTGLGLSIVYNTIKENSGFIHIYSEIGYGSMFKIYFPVIKDDSIIKESQSQKILHGSGTVLVVDDENIVRLVSSQMLSELGYDVLVAAEGEECIDIYKEKESSIDLVILDMIMPKMNGKDVFYKLKSINPEVKIIICSGFSMDISIEKLFDDGLAGFIQKPYKKLDLSRTVSEILNR